MKKIILLTSFLISVISAVNAQDFYRITDFFNGDHSGDRQWNMQLGSIETFALQTGKQTVIIEPADRQSFILPERVHYRSDSGHNVSTTDGEIDFTVSKDPLLDCLVRFYVVGIGPVDRVKYEWDFGDNTGSESKNTSHVYTSSGEFVVTLTVYGDSGLHKSVSKRILINSADSYLAKTGLDDKR